MRGYKAKAPEMRIVPSSSSTAGAAVSLECATCVLVFELSTHPDSNAVIRIINMNDMRIFLFIFPLQLLLIQFFDFPTCNKQLCELADTYKFAEKKVIIAAVIPKTE
jgi:hypothetical protein